MKIITSPKEMQQIVRRLKKRGKEIGLVPTMGALHKGHLSLVRKARHKSDVVIVSIFVNPRQFGPAEDFKKYPRTLTQDEELLKKEKVDFLFFPDSRQMYPADFQTEVSLPQLSSVLCGRSRPGHFWGVATVVLKLFGIVQPDYAFFGEKDYQQLIIIKQMVKDLNLPVQIIPGKTIREKSGLAGSSRNAYLSPAWKKTAGVLFQALARARMLVKKGARSAPGVVMNLTELITRSGGKIDYVALVDPRTLKEIRKIEKPVRLMLAVRIGGVRLIDNVLINPKF